MYLNVHQKWYFDLFHNIDRSRVPKLCGNIVDDDICNRLTRKIIRNIMPSSVNRLTNSIRFSKLSLLFPTMRGLGFQMIIRPHVKWKGNLNQCRKCWISSISLSVLIMMFYVTWAHDSSYLPFTCGSPFWGSLVVPSTVLAGNCLVYRPSYLGAMPAVWFWSIPDTFRSIAALSFK